MQDHEQVARHPSGSILKPHSLSNFNPQISPDHKSAVIANSGLSVSGLKRQVLCPDTASERVRQGVLPHKRVEGRQGIRLLLGIYDPSPLPRWKPL